MGYNHERRYELSLKWKGERNRASLFFNDYQNLAGFSFKEEGGKKYVRGADAVWVPLGNPVIKFFALIGSNNRISGINGTLNYADYVEVSYHEVNGGEWRDIYATFKQDLNEKIMVVSSYGGGLHFNNVTINSGQKYDAVKKNDQIWLNFQYNNYTDIIIICYGV
ncbi:hypothetical protein [Eisenbergiella massiliensis]|uniref:hypothetical protein n=1 Tax=Eisenbergiella massiliensis TaxID=1720294 RepID=UPI0011C18E72|nr:hypothetical protein [Eisenbergiella massiliensis]